MDSDIRCHKEYKLYNNKFIANDSMSNSLLVI